MGKKRFEFYLAVRATDGGRVSEVEVGGNYPWSSTTSLLDDDWAVIGQNVAYAAHEAFLPHIVNDEDEDV
jgi:hypothetical protein